METADLDARWEALLSRTMASLDDGERERLERLRRVGGRIARSGRVDVGSIDAARVKAYLFEYEDAANSNAECIRRSGTSKAELYAAYDLWPEFQFVRDYLSKCREFSREMDNEDMRDEAREGIRRMNTEDGCELNAKTLIHVNERLDREHFGTARDGDAGGGGRSQVTYVIPSLTVNNIMAPEEVAERMRAMAASAEPAIEAEAVAAPAFAGGR